MYAHDILRALSEERDTRETKPVNVYRARQAAKCAKQARRMNSPRVQAQAAFQAEAR